MVIFERKKNRRIDIFSIFNMVRLQHIYHILFNAFGNVYWSFNTINNYEGPLIMASKRLIARLTNLSRPRFSKTLVLFISGV